MRPESTILTTLIAGALLSLLLLPVMEQHAAPGEQDLACRCDYLGGYALDEYTKGSGVSREVTGLLHRRHREESADFHCQIQVSEEPDHGLSDRQ